MLFLFFKSDDFTGTYVLLSESVDKSLAKYARGVNALLFVMEKKRKGDSVWVCTHMTTGKDGNFQHT